MDDLTVSPVDLETVLQFRTTLSEPPRSREAALSPGDTAYGGIHLGARLGDKVVGVGSVGPEPLPVLGRPSAWRLRGLIVLPDHQRRGIGSDLVRELLEHVEAQPDPLAWCYAKRKLISYYGGCGMRPTGYTYVHPVGGDTLLFGNENTRNLIHDLTGTTYTSTTWPSLGAVEQHA